MNEMQCDKMLEEKFSLYETHTEYYRWKPYSLVLISYWKENL